MTYNYSVLLKNFILRVFIACVLFLSIIHSSFCEEKKFEESYLDLRVSQNVNNSYYKVYVDENEDPYINIRDFLANYLGFSDIKCDRVKLYCDSKMPPNDTLFWISGKTGEFGNSESSKSEQFDRAAITVIKKEIWIRYDVIGKWIPIDVNWMLDAYILEMNPKFVLLFDRKIEREELLKKLKTMQMKKETEQKREIIESDEDFNAVARLKTGISGGTKSSSNTNLGYDVTLDLLGGTGQFGQAFTFPFSTKRTIGTPYGTYGFKNQKYFYLMEAGTTNFEITPLLLGSIQTDYGFRFDSRNKSEQREGKVSITDLAPKGTEIDLYVDNYYISTAIVGDDGRYTFPEVIANSNSAVVLKIFYPNGLEEEKKINITKDGGNKLPMGQFEERVFIGKLKSDASNDNKNKVFYYTALRYGVLHNLTLGVSPMLLPNENHVTPMFDTCFMPFYWMNFLGQAMYSNGGIDRAFDINLLLLEPNFIQFEHKYYNVDSSIDDIVAGEYWALKHQVNFSGWSFGETYEHTSKDRKITALVRKAITKKMRASILGNTTSYHNSSTVAALYSVETALDFDFYANGRLGISRVWSSGDSQSYITYDRRPDEEVGGIDVKLKFSITDSGHKNLSTELSYKITEKLKLGITLQNQYISGAASLSWDTVIGGKNSPDLPDKYDYGTISGRILDTREKGKDGKGVPIDGVILNVGSETGTTDENGYYKITNIPTETVLTARIEANSLEGTLAPENEKDFIYFRKGSQIKWCPKVVPTIGLDGYLDVNGGVDEGVKMEAIRLSDYTVIATSEVDTGDGFFVLEKLTPGKYQLVLSWPGRKIKPIEINIKKTAEWITGARWDIDDSTFVFAKGDQAAETKVLDKEVVAKSVAKKDPVPVNIIATKDVDIANKLRGLQNIIQIKIHSAEINNDEESKKRIETYKKLLSITNKIEEDWATLSEKKKEESLVKIKKILTSKNLVQDEINAELLKKIRLEISNRVEKMKSKPTVNAKKKMEIYTRLDKIIDNLQKEWDRLSLDERATKIEGIKKIFKGLEK